MIEAAASEHSGCSRVLTTSTQISFFAGPSEAEVAAQRRFGYA